MRWLITAVLAVAGCRATDDPRPAPAEHVTTPSPVVRDATPNQEAMLGPIPPTGPFALPVAWITCATDDDCTIVTLGCCDETAVNRAHATATRTALEPSGRRYCPPKSACGPSTSGTWDGERGSCAAGNCRLPASR